MDTQYALLVKKDGGKNSKRTTSREAQLAFPKEKQQRKKSGKSKNISKKKRNSGPTVQPDDQE